MTRTSRSGSCFFWNVFGYSTVHKEVFSYHGFFFVSCITYMSILWSFSSFISSWSMFQIAIVIKFDLSHLIFLFLVVILLSILLRGSPSVLWGANRKFTPNSLIVLFGEDFTDLPWSRSNVFCGNSDSSSRMRFFITHVGLDLALALVVLGLCYAIADTDAEDLLSYHFFEVAYF